MYAPREDSYFFSLVLKEYLKNKDKDIKILDMGAGSGIQAETCKRMGFKNITAADIDEETVKQLKKKFKTIKSDLFSDIKGKFDLIMFNPPYLPEHKYDKEKDTTGGKKGWETIINFLEQAKKHLTKKGKILLLYSSLSKPGVIARKAKKLGYELKSLNKKKLFYEELYIVELTFLLSPIFL
jgi:release factor glutamine methyltransferase